MALLSPTLAVQMGSLRLFTQAMKNVLWMDARAGERQGHEKRRFEQRKELGTNRVRRRGAPMLGTSLVP